MEKKSFFRSTWFADKRNLIERFCQIFIERYVLVFAHTKISFIWHLQFSTAKSNDNSHLNFKGCDNSDSIFGKFRSTKMQ